MKIKLTEITKERYEEIKADPNHRLRTILPRLERMYAGK